MDHNQQRQFGVNHSYSANFTSQSAPDSASQPIDPLTEVTIKSEPEDELTVQLHPQPTAPSTSAVFAEPVVVKQEMDCTSTTLNPTNPTNSVPTEPIVGPSAPTCSNGVPENGQAASDAAEGRPNNNAIDQIKVEEVWPDPRTPELPPQYPELDPCEIENTGPIAPERVPNIANVTDNVPQQSFQNSQAIKSEPEENSLVEVHLPKPATNTTVSATIAAAVEHDGHDQESIDQESDSPSIEIVQLNEEEMRLFSQTLEQLPLQNPNDNANQVSHSSSQALGNSELDEYASGETMQSLVQVVDSAQETIRAELQELLPVRSASADCLAMGSDLPVPEDEPSAREPECPLVIRRSLRMTKKINYRQLNRNANWKKDSSKGDKNNKKTGHLENSDRTDQPNDLDAKPGPSTSANTKGNVRAAFRKKTKNNSKKHQCPENDCMKVFRYESLLQIHLRTHTGERPFKCDECSKTFNQRAHLKSHQLVHNGKRNFICSRCSKAFGQQSNLERHQQTHTSIRAYKCGECFEAFNQRAHLKTHQMRHTGDKNFTCSQCLKAFRHKYTLNRHQQTHG